MTRILKTICQIEEKTWKKKFQFHVSESKIEREDQVERIAIFKKADTRHRVNPPLQNQITAVVAGALFPLHVKTWNQVVIIWMKLIWFLFLYFFVNNSHRERVVGSLGINTLVVGVYFYAQMKNTFQEVGKIIPFDRIVVNQANGLKLSNKCVFTVPRAGIYHFTFK